MKPLLAPEILRIWERGRDAHPLERGLIVLEAGLPGTAWEELAGLSVGQRNAGLLLLRELTIGPTIESLASCPQCSDQLELSFQVEDIRYATFAAEPSGEHELSLGEWVIRYRLLTSRDLAVARRGPNAEHAGQALLRRCVVAATYAGEVVLPEQMPDDVVAALADAIGERDPQAEVRIALDCPSCGTEFRTSFDVESFFWGELAGRAGRVLREVHTLARAYGWRESDILAMSARRRQAYMELAPVV